MRHIRFLSTNKTVCTSPKALGYDCIVIDTHEMDSPSCKVCSQLVFAYNAKQDREDYQIWTDLLQGPRDVAKKAKSSLIRELTFALVFSTILWAVAFFVIWIAFFRA